METLNTIKVLDINVTSDSEKNILEFILMRLKKKGVKTKIFTPNSEIAVYATKHPSLKEILNSGDVNLPDGYWFVKGAQMLGNKLQGRITGVDFMQKLSRECAREGVSIGLLGGKGDVALKTAECLREKFPGLKIGFVGEEWGEEGFDQAEKINDLRLMINEAGKESPEPQNHKSLIINRKSIGVLFVAFGFPKQEKWISENIEKLPVQAMMSVGGAFDFLSGRVSRAPKWMQDSGLEWLYRLARQPWRWKRQLALIEFISLIIKGKYKI